VLILGEPGRDQLYAALSAAEERLASDAVISDGELIGDPTEGALVAVADKGGVDAVTTRQAYPRIAELPFDAAYKLMAPSTR
jgi:magnesium-transporting ATPase (P-type)